MVAVAVNLATMRTSAFSPVRTPFLLPYLQTTKLPRHRCLYASSSSNDGESSSSSSSFDADAARRRLESLLKDGNDGEDDKAITVADLLKALQDDDDDDDDSISLPTPPPPLTAADRERRVTEIQLMKQLDDSSSSTETTMALQLLWDLWFGERGLTAKKQLEQADLLMSDSSHWSQCETLLSNMIQEHGPYFCEPVNRLATLYYLQGRYVESYKLCRVVLHVKPWHVGALSGIVLVCTQLQGQREKARYWAEQRLPAVPDSTSFLPFDSSRGPVNPRRKVWVERAVQNAEKALQQAEQRTQDSFQQLDALKNDDNRSNNKKKGSLDAAEEDDTAGNDNTSWQ